MWGFESLRPCQCPQEQGAANAAGVRNGPKGLRVIMKDTKEASPGAKKESREAMVGGAAGDAFSAVASWPKRTKTFLHDVRAETRRVTWPSFSQVKATTVVVIVTVFLFAAYFGILDWIYTRAIGWILRTGQ